MMWFTWFFRRRTEPAKGMAVCKQCAAEVSEQDLVFKFAPSGRILFSACKRCTPDGSNELPESLQAKIKLKRGGFLPVL